MQRQSQDDRRTLDLSLIGLTEVPVFGRYEYCSARPGLATHVHPHAVEICYLERGCQTYRTAGHEYHLVGGDMFVTAPGEPHDTGGRVEERGILYWMNLKIPKDGGSILLLPANESASLINQLSTLPHRHFPGRPAFKQMFNEVFSLCERPSEPAGAFSDNPRTTANELDALVTRIAVANQIVRFILETISCAYRHEGIHRSPVISRLVERIKSNPERNYSLVELADEAELSVSRFKSKFKAQIGIAPHEFILRCKMEAAKELLRDRRKSVTDTAMELGFSSSQYFATVFRRFTQQTPVEFCIQRSAVPLRRATHAIQNPVAGD
ncbi:MAG TPA: AraC family transcriptional regulator [Bryobacteraceae bacterium]|nr:AraC family transcriptional regulator [Bryobacteraceae bacterium]